MTDQASEELKIEAEPVGGAATFKFTVDRPIYDRGVIRFSSKEDAEPVPLAKGLFDLEGVSKIVFAGPGISVTADAESRWPQLAYEVGKRIRDVIWSGVPLWPDGVTGSTTPGQEERRKLIQELIDQQINPSVAGHGGAIHLIDYDDDVVYVSMMGGCQGCGAADVTLRMGIERMLKERVPEVKEVIDVTDHAAGANPYYQPGKWAWPADEERPRVTPITSARRLRRLAQSGSSR